MTRHFQGFSGSKPLDPVGGVKTVQVMVKMNADEAEMATLLAEQKKISRSELIRDLLRKEAMASNREIVAGYFKAEKKRKRRTRA